MKTFHQGRSIFHCGAGYYVLDVSANCGLSTGYLFLLSVTATATVAGYRLLVLLVTPNSPHPKGSLWDLERSLPERLIRSRPDDPVGQAAGRGVP